MISRKTLQKSFHVKEYNEVTASDNLYCKYFWLTSAFTSINLEWIQFMAKAFPSSCGRVSSTFHDLINLNAFQILLQKLRPSSHNFSSKRISLPAGEEARIPYRTPSAPNCSIRPSASGLFPSCLLIFLRCLSLTMPVKYTS